MGPCSSESPNGIWNETSTLLNQHPTWGEAVKVAVLFAVVVGLVAVPALQACGSSAGTSGAQVSPKSELQTRPGAKSRTLPPRTDGPTKAPSESGLPADGSFNPNYRSSTNLIDGYPETVNGVSYPGYVDQEMGLAFQDCYLAADAIWTSNPPGTASYWTTAEDAWAFSSPPQYSKTLATQYACYYGYLVFQQNFF